MKHSQAANPIDSCRQLRWRAVLVVSAALIVGACRGPQQAGVGPGGSPTHSPALPRDSAPTQPAAVVDSPALPQASARPGAGLIVPVAAYADVPPNMAQPNMMPPNAAQPNMPLPNVAPPGFAMPGPMGPGPMGPAPMPFCPACGPTCADPWERPQPFAVTRPTTDEYLCDGGDRGLKVQITGQGEVAGLDSEDTVASFKTKDGRTLVQASNQVCIYSPRFGSVRQVVGLQASEQSDRTAGVVLPVGVSREAEVQSLRTNKQHIQANRDVGSRSLTIYRSKVGRDEVSVSLGPRGFQNGFMPYENFAVIRTGAFQEAEMARLAEGLAAAIVWTDKQSVRVILNEKRASEAVADRHVGTVYGTGELPGNPRLRIVKVASTHFAEPGDTVDFTLRFDNVGDQPIHNVTLLDNLSPRLDYVDQSAQCSVKGRFGTQSTETGTTVLRCEITDPLRPAEGGVLRFRCLVR